MLLEYAEASFECMEHRFRQLRGLACVKRVLQEYALANDVGLQFGDVPVGLVKMRLHQYIPGRPSNRAVISVEVVELNHEYGPASVVRLIDHPEMAMVAEHMVECLNLSGFVGFDFVLDSSNQAWLIEMNPRVTPISHFSLANGTSLAGSLYRQMTGLRPPSKLAPINRGLIALFPDEIVRSPSSEYLQSC